MNWLDRCAFLGLAGRSGAAMMMAGLAPNVWPEKRPPTIPADQPPNILVIMVDQWQSPHWFSGRAMLDASLPNTAALRQGAVSFTQHFAAATACTPSRSSMLTGLYTHQHFCILTEAGELHPDFPTFGDFLRQFGYATHWFGKWCVADDRDGGAPDEYLDPYGFAAHACPDPHGAPGRGRDVDEDSARQAANWLADAPARTEEPWCAVVSLVNPHDIKFGAEQMVDAQIGVVMAALESVPAMKNNTVVIFTGDHGECSGARGLRGKDGAVCDESSHVPLIIKDFSGKLQAHPGERSQLTSHVDLAPLLLTIAFGGNGWRTLNECAHLANRLDMLSLVRDPDADGRPYILHTTDEPGATEKAGADDVSFENRAPWHVICLRTPKGRFGNYSFWRKNSTAILSEGQETECYDCLTDAGQLKLATIADTGAPLFVQMQRMLEEDALYAELRAPLPYHLTCAQVEARSAYLAALG